MYESIVVGTDGSNTATRAVERATQLAESLGAQLHLVYAFEPVHARISGAPEGAAKVWAPASDAEAQAVIDEAKAQVRFKGVAVKGHTVTGNPAHALISVAAQEKADLIVVGSRGMHGVPRVLGSVPNTVSHRAECDVLIVSTGELG